MSHGTNPVKDAYWVLTDSKEEGNKREYYPSWICHECATSRGYSNRCTLSTFHEDVCGWCEKVCTVTQPRDYGYPKYTKKL